jgi:histidine triad (HIT) family protein
MMDNCVFCNIIKGDIPTKKIYENENFFSIPDAKPIVEGHSLVISKKHFKTSLDLPNSLGTELLDCIKKTSLKLIEDYNASGFNIMNNNFESAQQIVKHVHFHIIPRKKDDGEIKFIKKD